MEHLVVAARRFRRWALAVGLALLAGVAVAVIDPFADRQALNDEQLDTLRGGYESAQGLVFSFGIERAIVVNGELLATTRLVIDNFGALLSGQSGAMQIVAETQSSVPGPSAHSAAVSAPATVAVQPAASAANPPVPTPTSIAAASGGTPLGGAANPAAATGSYAAISGTPSQSQAVTSTGVAGSSVAPVTSTPAPVAAAGVSAPPSVASAPSTVSTGTTPASVSASGMGSTPVAANTTQPASTASPVSPSTSAPAQTAGAGGTPASASSSSAAPSQAASQATAPTSPASGGTSALYVQVNAAGTVILIPNGAALAASVQNSANDTRIQMSTQIDAVLSSLSAYRAGVIADAARQAAFARP